MTIKEDRQRLMFWLLALLAVVSLLLFLGSSLFNTKGEPREAVVALSMLQSGDWVSPVNNGVDIAYKPPFFHWCVALCSLLSGKVTEFSARFPSALATIVMVLSAFVFMLKNKVKAETALLTGLITLTTFEVHRAAMACRVDMMLSALTVMAIYAFQRWYAARQKWLILLIVLLLSGAFLTKGPIGALLPCFVMGVYMLVRGERFWRAFAIAIAFVLLSCILPLCWYYAAYAERGDTFLYLVYEENVLRFTGKMAYSSHEEPAIYNVLTLLAGFLPYTLLLVLSLFGLKYKKCKAEGGVKTIVGGWWHKLKGLSDQDLISLLSVVLIFVFYCIPKSKRSVYLLPVYPFLSYFVARFFIWLADNKRKMVVAYGWVVAVLASLIPVLLIIIKTGIVPHTIFHGKHASENLGYLVALERLALSDVLLLVFVSVVAVLAVRFFLRSKRKADGYRLCLSLTFLVVAINLQLDGVVLPRVFDVKSDYAVAQKIESLVPHDAKIWDYRYRWYPGERNRMHQFTVNFYLGDRIVPLDLNRPTQGYLIMGDDDISEFKKKYSEYKLVKIERFDHRSCDDKRMLTLYSFTK